MRKNDPHSHYLGLARGTWLTIAVFLSVFSILVLWGLRTPDTAWDFRAGEGEMRECREIVIRNHEISENQFRKAVHKAEAEGDLEKEMQLRREYYESPYIRDKDLDEIFRRNRARQFCFVAVPSLLAAMAATFIGLRLTRARRESS